MTIENPKEVQEGLGSGEIVMVMRKRLGVIRLISGRATAFRLGLGFFAPLLFASGGLALALATGHWANVLALPLACWIVFLPSGLSLVFFHVLPFLALSCLGLIVAPFFPRIGPELFVIPYLGMFVILIHKEALGTAYIEIESHCKKSADHVRVCLRSGYVQFKRFTQNSI